MERDCRRDGRDKGSEREEMRERGWEGTRGVKKSGKWALQVLVGVEYEVQGMTGAEKLILNCKISINRQKYSFWE